MTNVRSAAAVFCAGFALAASLPQQSHALDAFWHGVRSKFWHHGTNGEISNWYDMAPQSGNPLKVPDGTAIFAPGALRNRAEVERSTSIETVVFAQGTDPYRVIVRPGATLKVKGQGATNASGVEQKFVVRGAGAQLRFVRKAVACKTPGAQQLSINTVSGGTTSFERNSKANKSCFFLVNQDSLLQFLDVAIAGKSSILLNSPTAVLKFKNNSDPDRASIEIDSGRFLCRTFGKNGDRMITAKKIKSSGLIDLSKCNIGLKRTLKLFNSSRTKLSMASLTRYGRIHASSFISLGGKLKVEGSLDLKPGTYTFFQSVAGRSGKFSKVSFSDFPDDLTRKLVYSGTDVQLVLTQKP